MENPEFRRLFAIESLVAEAAESLARLMAERNVSKADLARRLNKSRAWVTQLLNGKANMTIRTLAEVAHALGAEFKLVAQDAISGVGKRRQTRRLDLQYARAALKEAEQKGTLTHEQARKRLRL